MRPAGGGGTARAALPPPRAATSHALVSAHSWQARAAIGSDTATHALSPPTRSSLRSPGASMNSLANLRAGGQRSACGGRARSACRAASAEHGTIKEQASRRGARRSHPESRGVLPVAAPAPESPLRRGLPLCRLAPCSRAGAAQDPPGDPRADWRPAGSLREEHLPRCTSSANWRAVCECARGGPRAVPGANTGSQARLARTHGAPRDAAVTREGVGAATEP